MIHHVDSKGVIQYSFYERISEIPWFMEVAKGAEERLEAIYAVSPDSCSSWYRQYREKKDAECLDSSAIVG